MRTQISLAKAAAAIAGLLIALALSGDVAAQPAELKGLSSAAPRSVLTEMSPVLERMTGRKLVVEYAFSPTLKRRIEGGNPFDVAILPPDMADDLMGRDPQASIIRVVGPGGQATRRRDRPRCRGRVSAVP
jgi:molybdate transport system substrate-binding protein